jgi:hypothetical protein
MLPLMTASGIEQNIFECSQNAARVRFWSSHFHFHFRAVK